MFQQIIMSLSPDNEDEYFVAMDTEDDCTETAGIADEVEEKMGSYREEGDMNIGAKEKGRTMVELPEEVLEYILSFLSPYQEHKTAALVCKQWYRLIKGTYFVFVTSCIKVNFMFGWVALMFGLV